MPQIGAFTSTESSFTGRIRTLSFDTDFVLVEVEPSTTDNAPDFHIHLGSEDGPEVGAGWRRTGERAGDYVAVTLDDPVFLAPIRAHLFGTGDDDHAWGLHWSRLPKRGERG